MNVVVRHLRRPHREPIVMLRRDDQIPHARLFDQRHPVVRIELRGIKRRDYLLFIDGERNFLDPHQVLGVAGERLALPFTAWSRVHAPMNEASELRVAPPCHALIARSRGSLDERSFRLRNRLAVPVGSLGGEHRASQKAEKPFTSSARNTPCAHALPDPSAPSPAPRHYGTAHPSSTDPAGTKCHTGAAARS